MTQYGSLDDLSDAQLQAALDRFDLGLAAAHAFTDGLFGKNIGLVIDTARWVLRGHPWFPPISMTSCPPTCTTT